MKGRKRKAMQLYPAERDVIKLLRALVKRNKVANDASIGVGITLAILGKCNVYAVKDAETGETYAHTDGDTTTGSLLFANGDEDDPEAMEESLMLLVAEGMRCGYENRSKMFPYVKMEGPGTRILLSERSPEHVRESVRKVFAEMAKEHPDEPLGNWQDVFYGKLDKDGNVAKEAVH